MTSINKVIMIGNIITKPEPMETSGKKKYVKFKLETWNFRKINGEVKKLTAKHTVLCFNSLPHNFLESAAIGTRIHLTGELDYDHQGNPQVVVPQYTGDLGAMDVPHHEEASENKPEQGRSRAPKMQSFGTIGSVFQRPQSTPPVSSKSGGGLGKLSLKKPTQKSVEISEHENNSPAERIVGTKGGLDKYIDTDGFTDSIPF